MFRNSGTTAVAIALAAHGIRAEAECPFGFKSNVYSQDIVDRAEDLIYMDANDIEETEELPPHRLKYIDIPEDTYYYPGDFYKCNINGTERVTDTKPDFSI